MTVGGVVVTLGLGLPAVSPGAPITASQGLWLAGIGAVLVVVGLVLFLSVRNGLKVETHSSPSQVRRDGDGDQLQAGRDIHVGDRITSAPLADAKPLLQLLDSPRLMRVGEDVVAELPRVRVVNRDGHRVLAARLCLMTQDMYGDQFQEFKAFGPSFHLAQQGASESLPVRFDLEPGESVNGPVRFILHEQPATHLILALMDRVGGYPLVREAVPSDELLSGCREFSTLPAGPPRSKAE